MAKGRTFTAVIKIQIVVDHLMNHDVSECLFIEIEVVGPAIIINQYLEDAAKLAIKLQSYCKFIGIKTIPNQIYFVTLQHNFKDI